MQINYTSNSDAMGVRMKNYTRIIVVLILLVLLNSCASVNTMSGGQQTLSDNEKVIEKADETTEIALDTTIDEKRETKKETTKTPKSNSTIKTTTDKTKDKSKEESERKSVEEHITKETKIQSVYTDILLHPEAYEEYYAVSENIPSDGDIGFDIDIDGSEPYAFAVKDINKDGTAELLLGYDLSDNYTPRVLLNILQYNEETDSIIDVDGKRTYPLMDVLQFYTNGYYATQNWVSDLYTECWYLNDEPDHYWYGWERAGEFFDSDGGELQLSEYYSMVGDYDSSFTLDWKEVTEENITKVFMQ